MTRTAKAPTPHEHGSKHHFAVGMQRAFLNKSDKAMSNEAKELSGYFFDNSIRPEQIIHLGTQCVHDFDEWESDLSDLFADYLEDICEAIGIEPTEELDDDMTNLPSFLVDSGKPGFLVRFATPVPKQFYSSGGYSWSWGHYTTKYIYGDTYEEACKKAMKWQADYIATKRAESA